MYKPQTEGKFEFLWRGLRGRAMKELRLENLEGLNFFKGLTGRTLKELRLEVCSRCVIKCPSKCIKNKSQGSLE